MKIDIPDRKFKSMITELIKSSMLRYNQANFKGDTRKEMVDLILEIQKDFMKQFKALK
jgi:hypothetical protein